MQISDIMSRRFECIVRGASIRDAARQMRDLDVGMLPVEDNGQIVGTVTDRDIAIRATAEGADPEATPVGEIMSKELFTCTEDDDIQTASRLMEKHQVRRLMVQNSMGQFVGMLALADLARHHEIDQLSAEVLEEISQPRHQAGAA